MLNVRPYFSTDYEKLLPFLQELNPTVGAEAWTQILEYKWNNKLEYKGMLFEYENKIVGFISYIFSSTKINGKEITFCNISSWAVSPEFRSKSLQLLSPLFKIDNIVITNLSPHKNTLSIFNALRFDLLSEYEYLINPFKLQSFLSSFKAKQNIICKEITKQNIKSISIDPSVKKLITDHDAYTNVHFYNILINNKQTITLAFNQNKLTTSGITNKIKEMPYLLLGKSIKFELLYCSDLGMFREHISEILLVLTLKYKTRIINISEHFMNKEELNFNYISKHKKDRPWFFYSENIKKYSDINLLYSEKVLLNF